MQVPQIDTAKIESLTLKYGSHVSPDEGLCVMEAVAFLAGEPHSDSPQCVSPAIGALMRRWNDRLPSDAARARWLRPLITIIVGTRTTREDEIARGYLAADWSVRWLLPRLCDRREKLRPYAEQFRALAPVTDMATAIAARDLARRAAAAAYAAAYAAHAAYAAAYAAAAAADAAADAAAHAADAAAYAAAAAAAAAAEKQAINESLSDLVRRMAAVGRG
jgi:hypothetical protein